MASYYNCGHSLRFHNSAVLISEFKNEQLVDIQGNMKKGIKQQEEEKRARGCEDMNVSR